MQQTSYSIRILRSAATVKEGPEAQQAIDAAAERDATERCRQQPAPAEDRHQQEQDSAGVQAALAMLKFYKAAISPFLAPACRFLPSCSVYSMDAFKQYGVSKGFVLTAWRLLRCNPWGSSGYDPVRWPPPGLEALFGSDGAGSNGSSGSDKSS